MLFDGIDLTPYFRIKEIRGRGLTNQEIKTLQVPGKDGEYVSYVDTPSKFLEIDIRISGANLREQIDALNEVLVTPKPVPIVFPDEPDKTYYGILESAQEGVEYPHLDIQDAMIVIKRTDPYKYGTEISRDFSGASIIMNNGTAEAEPIFELTVKKPVTFAMIQNNEDEYMMIGTPTDIEEQVINERTKLLDEIGDTLSDWTVPVGSIGSFIKGSQGIQVQSYGTGASWHGPKILKEISPAADFEIEFFVNVRSENPGQTFRISANYYDENMNELGMIRLWDNSDRLSRQVIEARMGPYVGKNINYLISSQNYDMRNQRVWNGLLRVTRKGEKYTFYVARITQAGRHVDTITQTFNDINNEYAGLLKFIQIDIANYGTTLTANEVGINRVLVHRLNKRLVDQTPYIAYKDDKIEFDVVNDRILINGEDRKDLKDFGSSYFKLAKGANQLIAHPADSFEVKSKYRPRFR